MINKSIDVNQLKNNEEKITKDYYVRYKENVIRYMQHLLVTRIVLAFAIIIAAVNFILKSRPDILIYLTRRSVAAKPATTHYIDIHLEK